ncbi:YheC/YheD family protein [Pseudobacteroides cellulosolvens]|uniref:Endospore coat-associated protein YheC/D n=1 Tax=Pseudobacteroides cellulosolvens ATCC 35603 = DSM 2933 TaxID=398512 RepID=A0A0L6JWN0_9FIRM|nr:YheC/YheD family protein [Pseudobacteroides cellulosolvens]KNY30020.1 Endospore coat-associated protein YheC/D [Pseudobacteroides cellulosolvens ATCC 35603 = DSM 2933]
MSKTYIIKTDSNNYSDFTISPKTAEQINTIYKKEAYVRFGCKRYYVNVKISEYIPDNVIVLSKDIVSDLNLPDYTSYEISVNKNEIIVGPYIGLLLKKQDKDFTGTCLKKLLIYAKDYSVLNGAIVIFALDKVDAANLLIEGFCYNPQLDSWQRGTFPYPSAIYRKIGLNDQWKNHFLSIMGDCVFNSHYFNKWYMYKWLSTSTTAGPHLPCTTFFSSCNDVLNMLKKFDKVYIKPASGLKGHGIVQASMNGNSIVLRYRDKAKNHETVLNNTDEACAYMDKRFTDREYIVQQGIDLLMYDEKVVDFRCVVQKNQWNKWECMAVFGRCGERGSVVSNISSGGTAFYGEELLKMTLLSSYERAKEVREGIEYLAVKACYELDECGINCGFLGLDIGVDVYGYLWLIEINNRDPCLLYALDVKDEELYYRLKTQPLYYAKYLAGF